MHTGVPVPSERSLVSYTDSRSGRSRPAWVRPRAAVPAIVLALVVIWGMGACVPMQTATPAPVEDAIVGKWVNPQGGTIHFYADGTGFIPGFKETTEPIPDTPFTYFLQNDTHLGIVMEGQPTVIMEIELAGDKMTWFSRANNVQYVYTRAR